MKESLDFADFYKRRTVIKVWDIELPVVDIDELIKIKRKAKVKRDKDKLDIKALLKLKEL